MPDASVMAEHSLLCTQTIKTWYKYAPEILGKKLAERKKLGGVKPEEERQVTYLNLNPYSRQLHQIICTYTLGCYLPRLRPCMTATLPCKIGLPVSLAQYTFQYKHVSRYTSASLVGLGGGVVLLAIHWTHSFFLSMSSSFLIRALSASDLTGKACFIGCHCRALAGA